MTLFVDASALTAIIAEEPERDAFAQRIAADATKFWSPMTCWETVSALSRSYSLTIAQARKNVEDMTALLGLALVPIGEAEMTIALDAHQRYGRGRHPARLNMGDCFAYACAKTNDARLLYKGNDFSKTDLA